MTKQKTYDFIEVDLLKLVIANWENEGRAVLRLAQKPTILCSTALSKHHKFNDDLLGDYTDLCE